MLHQLKPLKKVPDKLVKLGFLTTKRKVRRLKRDIVFVYHFAKNPVKFDFEFMFDETDMP